MTVSLNNDKTGFIYFGGAAKSTVQITGSKTKGRIASLADAIVGQERPDKGMVVLP